MSDVVDVFREGMALGWKVQDGSALTADLTAEADVVIVGTGAGGGVTAEILSSAGLSVILVEEGPLRTTRDFELKESRAYPDLYQESAARKTEDKAINILQGRSVGGSTTVNWTSSFRTPPATLGHWQSRFGLGRLTVEAMQPWFELMERRLGIRPWTTDPNANNMVLARGAEKLGISFAGIRRNVRGCWNLGYCGMGCITGAKQSMLVTTLPGALARGARLFHRVRAQRLLFEAGRATTLECEAMDAQGMHPSGVRLRLKARHFVLAGGAIGTPALLLRSRAPDPYGRLGKRTFLHPTVVSAAIMPEAVDGYAGAPQTIYSDHFLEVAPVDGPLGYKLEAPPLHPVLFSTTTQGFGAEHLALLKEFRHAHALIALMRDGFHPRSEGGVVKLRGDGSPVLDYPLNDVVFDGARRALATMAEIQFAAGARRVVAVHEDCKGWDTWAEARAGIAALDLQPFRLRLVSAHVMGGCGMAAKPEEGVVDDLGRHYQVENLSVVDGSVFPTSIGANPQLSIYGLAARNASALAERLTGRAVMPLV
ncbi:MAG: GMC family oxidoreductase [Rhodocyclaceae bacterium]|nr:GMC family oxidoreductase [Rhodocyclaceae bacterium]